MTHLGLASLGSLLVDLGQDPVALQRLGELVRRLGLGIFGEPRKEAVAYIPRIVGGVRAP